VQQPGADIYFDEDVEVFLKKDFTIQSHRQLTHGRQFVIGVNVTRSRIRNASVDVAFKERGDFGKSLDELRYRSAALISEVSWRACSTDKTVTFNRVSPKLIRKKLFDTHVDTLKPSMFHLATVFFTLEGQDTGYETDKDTSPVAFGVNYIIQVGVTGENLAIAPFVRHMVTLNAWNDIDVRPFNLFNLLRAAYLDWERSDSKWASLFRRIRSRSHP
jgi:hypothetical protein